MHENLAGDPGLSEKAAWIQENGQFVEAQDFYSFFVLIYLLNEKHIKLLYDFSGLLVSIESDEDTRDDTFLTQQLESTM
jgi:hypothetical protein